MEWKSVSEFPEKRGYVLIAYTHFGIPGVGTGFFIETENGGFFKERIYNGNGVVITHWMPMPEHPTGTSNREIEEESKSTAKVECRSTQSLNKRTNMFLPKG